MERWRRSLGLVLGYYEARRTSWRSTVLVLFGISVALNVLCYWFGLLVTFPSKLRGADADHYFMLQFPVGFLGALFDTASFFVTVWLVRRALKTKSAWEYCSHLGLDLGIAVLATFWTVFVFTAAGWIMSYIEAQPEALTARSAEYGGRLASALRHPGRNWRLVFFGLVMGFSSALPTLVHVSLFLRSLWPDSTSGPLFGDTTTVSSHPTKNNPS